MNKRADTKNYDRTPPGNNGGGWPLTLDYVEEWAWQTDVFSTDELDLIVEIGNRHVLRKGQTSGKQDDNKRNSYVSFIFPDPETAWIFQRLSATVTDINQRFFRFDLHGFDQGLQFTRYEAPGQHYDWHRDSGLGAVARKLSLVVQLSDPSDFSGGDLQFKFGKTDTTVQKERGLVTYFPSYALHRVKPVTQGTRYSLVAWVSGPPFK